MSARGVCPFRCQDDRRESFLPQGAHATKARLGVCIGNARLIAPISQIQTAIATNAPGYLRKSFEALSPEERAYYGEDFYNKSLAVCERFAMGRCVCGWLLPRVWTVSDLT